MTQGVIIAPTTGTLSGAALVADENVAAQVEMTDNAGAGWPTAASLGLTSLSCVLAHNTANNQIAVRDIADTAWIVLGTVDEVNKAYSAALKTDTSLRTSAAGLWQANEPITSVAGVQPSDLLMVSGEQVYILTRQCFSNGQSSRGWQDVAGAYHTLPSIAEGEALFSALASYVDALKTALAVAQGGGAWVAPAQPVTIP